MLLSAYLFSEDPWVALYHNFLTDSELTTANAEVDKFRFSKVFISMLCYVIIFYSTLVVFKIIIIINLINKRSDRSTEA